MYFTTGGGGLNKFNPNHDEIGRFTFSDHGTSVGAGYSNDAVLRNGVIYTSNVNDAVLALHEGKKVQLDQVRSVSTLISRLGKVAADMINKGEEAPNFDLCNVSVANSNLFCVDSAGIPRIEMPQIQGDAADAAFRKHLINAGYKWTDTTEKASYLRATQSELNGVRTARLVAKMLGRKFIPGGRMFVSQDNYIVDGHHRWAATIGVDAMNGRLGDKTLPITRVNIKILDLLKEARKFSTGAESHKRVRSVRKFNPNHDELGRFDEAPGGSDGTPEADKLTAYAATEHADLMEMPVSEGGIGFLTPKGEMIASMSGDSHDTEARKAGTTLDNLLREGTARIYADAPFLGIEIHRPPTKQQVRALERYAATRSYDRFAVDGARQRGVWPAKVADEGPKLTPVIVREQIAQLTWVGHNIKKAIAQFDRFVSYRKFNPHHDERGRFTTGPSSKSDQVVDLSKPGSSNDLKELLQMIAKMKGDGMSLERFVLDNGKEYLTDRSSFIGGQPNMCFKNAANAAMANRNLTYVEGYISVHGIPLQHAWTTDASGKVRDVTIKDPAGIQGYYGIPFKTDFMIKTVLQAKFYGLLNYPTVRKVIETDPKISIKRK